MPEKEGYYLLYCPKSFPKNCRSVVGELYIDGDWKGFYDEYDTYLEDVTHWKNVVDEPPVKK